MGRGSSEIEETGASYREELKVNSVLCLPLGEIVFRASRSSGPGGQHANKTESRIEAIFDVLASPTLTDEQKERLIEKIGPVIKAVAQDERSQLRNKELAGRRLAERLDSALKTERKRVGTKPNRSSKERRLEEKRQRGATKKLRQTPID